MTTKIKTWCPLFPGFYNTIFEYDRESDDIDYYNQENGTNYQYEDFNFDYKDYEQRVGKAFIDKLEQELKYYIPDIKINFEAINSPKEYNFRNDSIYIELEINIETLIALIISDNEKMEFAKQYFIDNYTSHPGFISFHSNKISDWLNINYINEEPDYRVGALLDCFCRIVISEDDIIYWTDDQLYINFDLMNK